MKNIFLFVNAVAGMLLLASCGTNSKADKAAESTTIPNSSQTEVAQNNTLTSKEKEEGWVLLFNGKNFDGWRGYNSDKIPSNWTIDDDAIKVNASEAEGGDIIYDKQFKNFELQFDWKVSKGGNSGVFYLAKEIEGQPIYRSAPEYQVLDNVNHPDAKLGKNGNRKSASLYDLIPAEPQNSKPYGEWNTGSIIVNNGKVIHMQNGEKVVEYELWTPEWEALIDGSKFKGWTEMIHTGGDDHQGFIGLQDHGNDIWFRNIKVKTLD